MSSSCPADIIGTCHTSPQGEIKCTPGTFEVKAVNTVRQFKYYLPMPDDTSLTIAGQSLDT